MNSHSSLDTVSNQGNSRKGSSHKIKAMGDFNAYKHELKQKRDITKINMLSNLLEANDSSSYMSRDNVNNVDYLAIAYKPLPHIDKMRQTQ